MKVPLGAGGMSHAACRHAAQTVDVQAAASTQLRTDGGKRTATADLFVSDSLLAKLQEGKILSIKFFNVFTF